MCLWISGSTDRAGGLSVAVPSTASRGYGIRVEDEVILRQSKVCVGLRQFHPPVHLNSRGGPTRNRGSDFNL